MNNLKLTNSLTRKKETFKPINLDKVSLYACGPTVYDNPHVGNARTLVVFDILFRVLKYIYGNNVKYVRNITDVDDKIIEASKKSKKSINEITKNIDSNKIINLFGASLTQTAAYMKKSKLFIGNDSGLSHMASATNLKSIILFGPTNDVIYGPFMQDSQVIRTNESYDYFNK